MKSVLMITRYFPPEGSAGSFRPLRFARYLPSQGWHPTVLTLDSNSYERYDPSLLSQIPKDIVVIRVRNKDPWQTIQASRERSMQKLLMEAPFEAVAQIRSAQLRSGRSFIRELVRMAEAWCYHPDPAMGWIRPAVKAAVSLCNRKRPDVIWATAGPVSAFTIAQRVSRETGIPYMLDFRDAWTITYNDFDERRPPWAKHLDRRNMFAFLQGAKAIVFRYETEAECYWRAYNGALDASRIHIIPNGYEGEVDRFTVSRGQKCNILYTGTLPDYRYDSLLEALTILKQSSREQAQQLNLQFIGEGTESLAREATALGLNGIVTTSGPTPHDTVTRLSGEADALLLLGRAATMRGYELFAAAKLFGYLKAGRPIIGILPNDEAKKILTRVGISTIADVDSVSEITAVLRHVLHKWRKGELQSLLPNPHACRVYSAETQVASLVCAFEGKPPAVPFVPGLVDVPISLREFIAVRERASKRKANVALCGAQIHSA